MLNFIKIKGFHYVKETIKRMEKKSHRLVKNIYKSQAWLEICI